MALPTLDSVFASAADLPRRQMLAKWLVEELGSGSIADYWTLPERYLWAKIAVAAGAPRGEADYISLPKNYVWSDIYNAVSGSSLGTIDWSEKQALGHIAAAYRGDTGNPANLATYIDWPWRYQVASIITSLTEEEPTPQPNGNGGPETFNAVIVSGGGSTTSNGTYTERGTLNSKLFYNLLGQPTDTDFGDLATGIYWDGSSWNIVFEGSSRYFSNNDTAFPWLATFINTGGEGPTPTLTAASV
jgi:hypothetical protein